ncbi:MAG: EAL domain-containing protein, partial [Litorimonas sp.]
ELANKSPSLIVGGCMLNRNQSAHQHLTYTDVAIREAIASGKNHLAFDEKILAKIEYKQSIEQAIKLGLDRKLFSVAYQPIIDLMTEQPIGFEALIRLQTEAGTSISPVNFIPIAESAGLLNDITDYLCDRVSAEAVEIYKLFKNYDTQPYVNVNISPSQLIDVKRTVTALKHAEKSGVKINVEITESGILNDDSARRIFNVFQTEGFSIAIDDFGTGHSSIQHLERYNFSTLKVDQSFVSNIDDPQAYRFLNAIINLARTAATYTIVEGVETLQQKLLLMKMGVRFCQGYYWGHPMKISELEIYLTEKYGFNKARKIDLSM